MSIKIRKTLLHVENIFIEGGKECPTPLKLIAAVAVIENPWAGQGFVENLTPKIHEISPILGNLLTDMIIKEAGGGDKVEGYGKASVVGLNGEVEHGSALIHTLHFGNPYRQAVGAQSYLSFCNTRAGAGNSIQIPLMDKNDEGKRSHYLTIELRIPDSPNSNEIVIALGASVGGRPHHRIGDRYQDLKELGHDTQNPANIQK